MLRTIDRYLLAQFIQIFIICFVSLYGLFVVVDAFGHFDHFADHAKEHGGLLNLVAKYYSYRAVAFFDRTSGILCLMAAMFTLTWIERFNELTALLAAGISRMRVLRPVFLAALFFCGVAVANRELVMPRLKSELSLDSRNLDGGAGTQVHSRTDSTNNILIDGDQAIVAEKKIIRPSFLLPNELSIHGRQIVASEAVYLSPTTDRPGGYLFTSVIKPENMAQKASLDLNGKRVVYTPRDTPGLEPNQVFVATDVPFELIAGGSAWRDYASTQELITELQSPSVDLGNDVRVQVHTRLLQPVMDCTLLMLGLPIIASRRNRNPFLAIGLSMGVILAFFVVTLSLRSVAISGWISPTLAAWGPILVFVPVAAYLFDSLES